MNCDSFDPFGRRIELRNDVRFLLMMVHEDVQNAVVQCRHFFIHWRSVQCTLPLKGERVPLHLCEASPRGSMESAGEKESAHILNNLLRKSINVSAARLAWVFLLKTERERKSVSATQERRGCGIWWRGAVSDSTRNFIRTQNFISGRSLPIRGRASGDCRRQSTWK